LYVFGNWSHLSHKNYFAIVDKIRKKRYLQIFPSATLPVPLSWVVTMNAVEQSILSQVSGKQGQYRGTCPFCSHTRKNKTDRCLSISVTSDNCRYSCWHCDEKGGFDLNKNTRPPPRRPSQPQPIAPVEQVSGQLTDAGAAFLASRNVSRETAVAAGVFSTRRWFRKLEREGEALAFPYKKDGAVTGIKFRCLEVKDFAWTGSAEGLWGIENIVPEMLGKPCPIIITEGELDRLALLEAGVVNAVSVPNGAPTKISEEKKIDPQEDRNFSYIWRSREALEEIGKVVICTDNDLPGEALGEELARRIGKAACWQVTYPEGTKDANDVLIQYGADAVQELIDEAKPWPVAGLYDVDHYSDKIDDLWNNGPGTGLSTGLASLDDLFTLAAGQLVIATGAPGSGKSELIDQICVNMAKKYSIKTAVCSFENPPHYHVAKLAEKVTSKPFFDGPNPRMTKDELAQAKKWIGNHFSFMDWGNGAEPSLDAILDRAKAAVLRLGVRVLVIDPFNYLRIDKNDSETNVISNMLSQIRAFAIAHEVTVFFVAHPQKLRRNENGETPVPKGWDISGSAAWFAKADLGITAHRPQEAGITQVFCWKSRWKWQGHVGDVTLSYNPLNGRYSDAIDWEEVNETFSDKSWENVSSDSGGDWLRKVGF
jgi:twinkle protein